MDLFENLAKKRRGIIEPATNDNSKPRPTTKSLFETVAEGSRKLVLLSEAQRMAAAEKVRDKLLAPVKPKIDEAVVEKKKDIIIEQVGKSYNVKIEGQTDVLLICNSIEEAMSDGQDVAEKLGANFVGVKTAVEESIINEKKCKQCDSCYINGVFCHETGCLEKAKEEQEAKNQERADEFGGEIEESNIPDDDVYRNLTFEVGEEVEIGATGAQAVTKGCKTWNKAKILAISDDKKSVQINIPATGETRWINRFARPIRKLSHLDKEGEIGESIINEEMKDDSGNVVVGSDDNPLKDVPIKFVNAVVNDNGQMMHKFRNTAPAEMTFGEWIKQMWDAEPERKKKDWVVKESKINEIEHKPVDTTDDGEMVVKDPKADAEPDPEPEEKKIVGEPKKVEADRVKKEQEAPDSETEQEKRYIGQGGENHYYMIAEESGNLQLVDQEGKAVYPSKEKPLETKDPREFIQKVMMDVEIDTITRDIVLDFIIPKEEEKPEAEEVAEEQGLEDIGEMPAVRSEAEPPPHPVEKERTTKESKVNEEAAAKPSFDFEVALSVSDYYDDGDPNDDPENGFDRAKDATDDAKKVAIEELEESGVPKEIIKRLKIDLVEFVEFDSGNPTHAGAYFHIVISSEQPDDIAVAKDKWEKWMNESKKPRTKFKNYLLKNLGEKTIADNKKLIEMKVSDGTNEFEVTLTDDGSLDTVIAINGREFRFDSEFASMWRDAVDNQLSEEGLRELALDAISNMEPEEYEELLNKAGFPDTTVDKPSTGLCKEEEDETWVKGHDNEEFQVTDEKEEEEENIEESKVNEKNDTIMCDVCEEGVAEEDIKVDELGKVTIPENETKMNEDKKWAEEVYGNFEEYKKLAMKDPAFAVEYERAKDDGETGTFEEWLKERWEVLSESKAQHRGKVVFSAEKSKDKKDHFPINSAAQARNALARSHQYKSAPSWYSGSLSSLQNSVRRAVKKAYPSIEIKESVNESKSRDMIDPSRGTDLLRKLLKRNTI